MEGERQMRQGQVAGIVDEAVRGLRSRARVEAEPVELVADLLIQSREEPALVGVGIEIREVRFV